MEERIFVFDTTLEEGEHAPGCSFNLDERLRIAHQLERLHPDVIEAGSPMSSPADFEAVRLIARSIESCAVAARCRPAESEVHRAWEAIQSAKKPLLHLLLSLPGNPPGDEIDDAFQAVRLAKSLCPDVQVSFEYAPEVGADRLSQYVPTAILAGATVVGLPDTAGYATPDEYGELFKGLRQRGLSLRDVVLSARCWNDLGLAVANAFAALRSGARQVECSVNGIGGRAGVTALEEIVMLIQSHRKQLSYLTDVRTGEIHKSSRLLSSLSGTPVQRNKPIVGANAFAQQNFAHLGQVLNHTGYEIIAPESVGIKHSTLLLGRHSDKRALQQRYAELGYDLSQDELERACQLFRQIVEQKKEIFDEDLTAILDTDIEDSEAFFHLERIQVLSGTALVPTATVELRKGDQKFVDSAAGDGPVDAAYKAIERIAGITGQLTEYLIKSVSLGRDGFGEVFVRVDFQGLQFHGRGLSTDVITGSAKAYLEAVNRALAAKNRKSQERSGGSSA